MTKKLSKSNQLTIIHILLRIFKTIYAAGQDNQQNNKVGQCDQQNDKVGQESP